MRKIKYIVLHCTATASTASVEAIKRYWKEQLKWKNVGYHYIIKANGDIEQLANEDSPTNGVRGFNSTSIHIAYIGGKDSKDTRSYAQKQSIQKLLNILHKKYPDAEIKGHRDFEGVKKNCPCFDVKTEYFL